MKLTEEEVAFANMVLGAINVLECPMLMCKGEKDIVAKALRILLEEER